jgi:hypothetical protein
MDLGFAILHVCCWALLKCTWATCSLCDVNEASDEACKIANISAHAATRRCRRSAGGVSWEEGVCAGTRIGLI